MSVSRKKRKEANLKAIAAKEVEIKLTGTGKIVQMNRKELEVSLCVENC